MRKYLFLVVLAVLSACADVLVDENLLADGKYTLTVEATKGDNTKALGFSDGKLNATWAAGDVVTVYNYTKGTTLSGTLSPNSTGSATTKLSGTLTGTIDTDDKLILKFLSPSYATQDGTLTGNETSIDKVCDYAEATVNVKSRSGGNITLKESSASFENQQAIVKFTLKKKVNDAGINATQLTVSDGTNAYTVTPASARNEFYVAIPAFNNKTVTLTATDGNDSYIYEKPGVTFDNSQYYEITVKMASAAILPGKFSINAGGGQVNFSKGNLQYQASTGTWRFAPNQYDMIGSDNANISDSYTGWIDLFGWGTGDAPTKATQNNSDYSTFTDWGVNAISNGDNTANMWSTLTKDEWAYIFEHHTKGWSTVNGVNGYVIRPDGVSTAIAASYTSLEWAVEEAAGSVFLPAGNSRGGTTYNTGSWGDYWSSTPYNSNDAYYLYFHANGQNPSQRAGRFGGRSVRLVYEAPYFTGAGTEADPYRISSQADWNYLAIKVNSGTNYIGKFFRLTEDISVTTMVGNSESNSFRGTFNGDGHTLTVTYNTTEKATGPFRYVRGATIKNLHTAGTITTSNKFAGGLVGLAYEANTITNCRSSVFITSSVSGDGTHGGLIGDNESSGSVTTSFEGCVFDGKLLGSDTNCCGGFVGWSSGTVRLNLINCLYAPQQVTISESESQTFSRNSELSNISTTNCYYTQLLGGTQGLQTRSITGGTDVTVANAGPATVYDVSGITSYGTGILYDGVLYAGNGEAVSLTLSHAEAPTGYTFSQYTVTGGGSLSDPTSNSPTLTMTDANQTINVEWAFNTLTFNYTEAVQTFTVPTTGYYTLVCYGAQGGYSSSGLGGKGGLSQLTYPLTQGDVLYIYVGGQGECIDGSSSHPVGGDGGWNGGGKGGTGVQFNGKGTPYNGGGGGGGATHIATSDIGAITGSTDFTSNHAYLLLIAGGGGGGTSWNNNAGGSGGGDEGGKGRHNNEWSIAWNNGTLSCGRDGMTSSTGGGSAEGCGGGGAGYVGGNTWTVTYNASEQSYSGAGGSSWGETTNGKGYSTTSGGATAGGDGKAVITWFGSNYPM